MRRRRFSDAAGYTHHCWECEHENFVRIDIEDLDMMIRIPTDDIESFFNDVVNDKFELVRKEGEYVQ